ncbi:hypothetical protein E6Q11_01470 [Candidatus Dojkabacteria bacterium]|uniref:Uncharacterized protein n=1 Tax=Candidatus Dojkabacteria bacterium TaxID=2099670 RepID=A0A5C7J9I4_9BACT|nr:MAG: hypothetical protein E6Q11_01470 [Candidatus Dojkabacteria bacterium]
MQTRYFKTKQRIQQFIPLQLGLCLMRSDNGRVIYNPLNFYLYPGAIG